MPSAAEDTDDSSEVKRVSVQNRDNTSVWARPKKPVSIDEQDGISPLMLAKSKEVDDFDLDTAPRYFNSYLTRRITRSKSSASSSPSLWQSHNTQSAVELPKEGLSHGASGSNQTLSLQSPLHPSPRVDKLISEVISWLHAEKAKKKARKAKRKAPRLPIENSNVEDLEQTAPSSIPPEYSKRMSDVSDDASPDLDTLESILENGLGEKLFRKQSTKSSSRNLQRHSSRRSQILRRQSTNKSSDTEYYDDDQLVPSCDAVLDCSQLSGSGVSDARNSVSNLDSGNSLIQSSRGDEPWLNFKYEITRLAHTLKLKAWRQVPLSNSNEIGVERLSGALTNAVYVVSPPPNLPVPQRKSDSGLPATRKSRRPLYASIPIPASLKVSYNFRKLILRIYGPNVEHLIDRESELRVLRRLARKHIGPRVLGTFTNGRFEEYFHAEALRPQDLRVPATSKQIAKRMRELHDGIELLKQERIDGPFVWKNWNRWVSRATELATLVDTMVRQQTEDKIANLPTSKLPGLVCGTSWAFFRHTVEKYKKELDTSYGSPRKLMEQLVFAHNDTQYGNILRIEPPGESPLLLPVNKHKQLVVIDFEYANANVPGFEFANHFAEWCYNYHDPVASFKCNTMHYPSTEQQYRFIHAYVTHRPQYAPAAPATPRFTPLHLSRSVSSLALDARNPTFRSPDMEDPEPVPTPSSDGGWNVDAEVQRLMHETLLWRIACSAQWVVWGILQAKITGDTEDDKVQDPSSSGADHLTSNKTGSNKGKDGESSWSEHEHKPTDKHSTCGGVAEDEGFDYLNYARERALFFWGDCLQMGLVTKKELGDELMEEVKLVSY